MFLSVEWAKRWLPTVFLLLSLFVPWWTFVHTVYHRQSERSETDLILSFPWEYGVVFEYRPYANVIQVGADVLVYQLPRLLFVSVLIMVAGLCGLTGNNRTRTLGGLLGIAGVLSYFILVFSISVEVLEIFSWATQLNPHFGMNFIERQTSQTFMWFLSAGFYLALAGSLMLLLPLIKTSVERLRKRL